MVAARHYTQRYDYMKSAIKTIETKIHGLKIELSNWSDPRNFSQRIIDECKQEIKEHEEALKKLNCG